MNTSIFTNDPILLITLLVLAFMSILSWTIAVVKFFKFHAANKGNKEFLAQYFSDCGDSNLEKVVAESTSADKSPLFRVATSVLQQKKCYYGHKLGNVHRQINFDEFISRQIQKDMINELRPFGKGLSVLASVGSMSPFVGLFGTVIGIYHALQGISLAGQVSIAAVAGPIGEALISTAFGLFVAVPAILFYNFFLGLNKNLRADIAHFGDDLRTELLNESEK